MRENSSKTAGDN